MKRVRDRAGDVPVRSHPQRRYRLKRSIEVFHARNGSTYLLRLGAGDDVVLEGLDATDRILLEALAKDFVSPVELAHRFDAVQLPGTKIRDFVNQFNRHGLLETREGDTALSDDELERYDRQLIYFADLAAPDQDPRILQERLSSAKVALIGCGGPGTWAAASLACAGVGALILVDDDTVELSNLNRQVLYTEQQLGRIKVDAAAEALRARNRRLAVVSEQRRIECPGDLDPLLATHPDLVILTADWPPHELPRWVNGACHEAGIPWIGAGQFPPRLRIGPMVIPGRSPCLECLEQAVRRDHPLYDELAAWRGRKSVTDASVGAVSGVIGSLLASEAIHCLTGARLPASVGAALVLDLGTMGLTREPIVQDPGCEICSRIQAPQGQPSD